MATKRPPSEAAVEDGPQFKKARCSSAKDELHHPKPRSARAGFLPQSEPQDVYISRWIESVHSKSTRNSVCRSCPTEVQSSTHYWDNHPFRSARTSPDMAQRPPSIPQHLATPGASGSTSSSKIRAKSVGVTTSAPSQALVEQAGYRDDNLQGNDIYMRRKQDSLPPEVKALVGQLQERVRDSPSPTLTEIRDDDELEELGHGAAEPDVAGFFHNKLATNINGGVKLSKEREMNRAAVPCIDAGWRVSIPKPDALYGYKTSAFSQAQTVHLRGMSDQDSSGSRDSQKKHLFKANSDQLLFPFFLVEFKGDGSSGKGSMYVATNQCLGGTATCIYFTEKLNKHLEQYESVPGVHRLSSTTFSVAMSNREACLYVSWKEDDLKFYTQVVKGFLVYEPEQYKEFRRTVRNIIDWGRDTRLQDIHNAIDHLIEESAKAASEQAKARPGPHETGDSSSTGGADKRQKQA